MREIKFRGLDKCRKWNYGDLINHRCGRKSITDNPARYGYGATEGYCRVVENKTIGQFTGLQDKNGVEIYEGDNLRLTNGKFWWTYVVSTIPNNRTSTLYAVEVEHNVTSEDDRYTYEISDSRKGIRNELEFLDCKRLEIIGNIHENKELLK